MPGHHSRPIVFWLTPNLAPFRTHALLTDYFLRATLALLWLQMVGTVTPLFLYPELCFTVTPIAPTLEGQYIIKNMVLIAAGIVIGAMVRGGRLTAVPVAER